MIYIANHSDDAVKRLIAQYRNKPRIEAILRSFTDQIQEIEDQLKALLESRLDIDNTSGFNLDRLGDIIGQTREGLSDIEYRIRIKTRIIQNVSQGEPEKIIEALKLLTGGSLIHVQDLGFGSVICGTDAEIPPGSVNFSHQGIERVTPSGVRVDFLVSYDSVEPFAFEGDLLGDGFGDDLNPSVGGKFAFEYYRTIPEFSFGDDAGYSPDPNTAGFSTFDDPLVGGMLVQ